MQVHGFIPSEHNEMKISWHLETNLSEMLCPPFISYPMQCPEGCDAPIVQKAWELQAGVVRSVTGENRGLASRAVKPSGTTDWALWAGNQNYLNLIWDSSGQASDFCRIL